MPHELPRSSTPIVPAWPDAAGLSRLAALAFDTYGGGAAPSGRGAGLHLAFLHRASLALDLGDPAQRLFGDYELIELLGEGGMGVVYRARQRSLDREVALKLLAAGPWASRDFIARFVREARNAARMQHPNIVPIYEVGTRDELHFFSMRLIVGGSLAVHLRVYGPFAPQRAAQLIRSVAEAVDYAHRLGMLHLDLKPGNVLLDERDEPQVADFGLARRLDHALAAENEEVCGTPSYMAPEQAELHSHKLTPATDIWGLGAVLYELLTGQPPFLADTPQATLQQVLHARVRSPRRIVPTLPRDLEAIVLRCLQKSPQARYPTARALADDLGRFLEGRAVHARPLGMPQRLWRAARREPRLAALTFLLIAALATGFTATSLQWRRAEINAATSRSLLWDSRREAALRLEREGHGFEALPRLLQNIAEEERSRRTGMADMDRRRVGMLVAQGATLIDRTVIADANPMAVELSPDGRLLAVALNDQSVRWYDTRTLAERGRVSLAGRLSADGQRRIPLLLRFAGDRRLRVTFEWYSNAVSPTDSDTWLIDLDRAALIEPPAAFGDFADAAYSADGRHALLRNHRRQSQLWQLDPWRPLSSLGPTPEGRDFMPWKLSPDGRFAATLSVAMRTLSLYRLPDLATPRTVRLPGGASISAWAFSGDGNRMALGDFEGRVFLLDARTLAQRQLATPGGREVSWIAFSEDDAWLAAATRDGAAYAFDVATGNPLVSGQMQHDFSVQRVAVSHRQRLLIAAGEGETALWHLPLPGPRSVPATRVGAGPSRHGLAGRYPIGWSLRTGLLASAGMDGQLRLWRLPLSPMLEARAARQVPEQTWFDGKRLVDVAYDQLRLVSVQGTASTPWLKLPQPPGFAELVDRGRSLVVTVGPALRVYDTADLRLRFPPVALPDSPQRLLADRAGDNAVLAFGGSGAEGYEERLAVVDLQHGRLRPGRVALEGPLRRLAFSADGARLLATGPPTGATTVLETASLRRVGEYPHDPLVPVLWAAFAADDRQVLMVARADDPRLGDDALIAWDPAADAIRARRPTGSARPIAVAATGAGAFVAGSSEDLFDTGEAAPRIAVHRADSAAVGAVAVSADGKLVAHAFRREVQLYDATTAAAAGPPLHADSNAMDAIAQLAFSPDGNRLLGRTVQGHWLVWPIAPEQRPAGAMQSELARLGARDEAPRRPQPPTAAERAALRARDPGAWPAAEIRPQPPPRAR
ncbi:MAG: WD40 repeat domain-containing serine/threonine protein kinase [Mizugakiibacter sp.]|uniref:WD40 repeat domain-containing serine/threonine protein kinase n=1 Tax=Mizugakiibacter sp. TaxID=1972610 RepID=UPI0031CABDFF|nr:WD40 repeat domain-containing serine/threonine protein kinase [Xanthomonadaceae bacterium]